MTAEQPTKTTHDALVVARMRDLADAYENYAETCDRDVARWPGHSPTGQHWHREAAQARTVAKRIRHALRD